MKIAFLMLLAAAVWLPIAVAQTPTALPPPKGLYVLNDDKGPYPLPEWAYKDPDVDGVSVRLGWGMLQPEEGKFVWDAYDREIPRAKKAGKKVMLRAFTGFRGRRMAEWVYAAGAQRFNYVESQAYVEKIGTKLALPVPWDPIFLHKWTSLIRAMGQRYDGEETVVLIHMAGLDYTGGEMHLPKTPEDRAHWRRIGYSKTKLVGAWRIVIDAYATAFPNKFLALNVSAAIENDGTVEEVIAYAERKLGRRFCIQHNALCAEKNLKDGYPHKWITAARGSAIIGFQQLCPVTPVGSFNDQGRRFGGPLEVGLRNGMEAGMRNLEIYPADMHNPSLRPVLHEFAERMRHQP